MASFIKPREENPISNSLQEALIYLNKQTIEEGKIYSRRYYTNSSKTAVDVVLAVGVLPGVGPSCYSILSYTKKTVVWGVSDSLPDVSEVTLGRLYIYWEPNAGRSYIVYLLAGDRIVEPISFPLIVHNVADSHMYYVSERSIVDIYEHLEGIFEMEERINNLEQQLKDLKDFIENSNTTTPPPPSVDPEEPEPEDPTPEEPEENTTTPPPSVNFMINSFVSETGTQFELGQPVNPKLTWSYNLPIDYQKINGVELDPSFREFTYEGITTDTVFILEASAQGVKKTKQISLEFSAISYSGSSEILEIGDITSENFLEEFTSLDMNESGLSNVICTGTVTKTFTFTTRSSLFFAFPKDIASKLVIIDASLNSPVNCTKANVTVTNNFGENIEYTIFESPAVYSPGTTITWIFNF